MYKYVYDENNGLWYEPSNYPKNEIRSKILFNSPARNQDIFLGSERDFTFIAD